MLKKFQASPRRLAVVAALAGLSAAPMVAQACSVDPILGSMCVMAAVRQQGFNNQYVMAQGQLLPINGNAALYSLLGTTYGGDARNTFGLPNLQGRTIIGAGTIVTTFGPLAYSPGATGGAPAVLLGINNLPPHNHAVTSPGVAATTTLPPMSGTITSLTATANLASISFSSSASTLRLNAVSTATRVTDPTNNFLTTGSGATNSPYTSAKTPTVQMDAGAITGGVSGTLSGTAPVTATGGAVSISAQGSPVTTLTGVTANTGGGTPFSIMQPYVAMNYYIATNGIYPSYD